MRNKYKKDNRIGAAGNPAPEKPVRNSIAVMVQAGVYIVHFDH